MSDEARTTVSGGALRGTTEAGIDRYLGVPFAAAPVGVNRFALPQPHPGWPGERDATAVGPTPPQAPYGGGIELLLPTVTVEGDEILNLNVWTPQGAHDLPVMVWVYGGSFAHGANALDSYDGTTFARDGVVYVAVNYRVGSEGFSVIEGAPLNLGLADILAALRWVQQEIRAFGGDPARVTVFGESAGAIAIGDLIASPQSDGLFSRAIMQSGIPSAAPRNRAARVSRAVAKILGVAPTRAAFSSVDSATLVTAQSKATAGSTPVSGGLGFGPAIGGDILPVDPVRALHDGAGSSVPLLIGGNTEEYRFWFVPTGMMSKITPTLLALARVKFRIGSRTMKPYRANRPGASRGELFGALATDIVLRLPINRLADARLTHRAPTWVYEFAWRSPVQDLGAAHVMEIPFVFDAVDTPGAVTLIGDAAPQQLAHEMHSAWIAFAKTGDPGWEPWNSHRPVQVFDAPGSGIHYAPREDERASWRR